MPKGTIVGSYVNAHLVFLFVCFLKRHCHIPFQGGCTIWHPYQPCGRGLLFLHPHCCPCFCKDTLIMYVCCSFWYVGMLGYFITVLLCISLMGNDEHLLMCWSAICTASLAKYLFVHVCCLCSNWVVCLFFSHCGVLRLLHAFCIYRISISSR